MTTPVVHIPSPDLAGPAATLRRLDRRIDTLERDLAVARRLRSELVQQIADEEARRG